MLEIAKAPCHPSVLVTLLIAMSLQLPSVALGTAYFVVRVVASTVFVWLRYCYGIGVVVDGTMVGQRYGRVLRLVVVVMVWGVCTAFCEYDESGGGRT